MSTSSSHKAVAVVPTTFRESTSSSAPPSKRSGEVDNRYLAGDVIADRYRLVKKLGEGGMGVVWVAHSLVLGVDIALKLISASAAGRSVGSRMAREAHAAARLGHPALVRVFDFGWTTRGDPFLVMELAQGETLSKLLERESRIGAVRAVQLLLPICDGIRCAHEKGIVHRDIKPENVFIAADSFGRLQPKLLDFGIAKMDQQQPDGRLTQVGAVLGSPEFMSPEQARGDQDIDLRTDVWSTAVMLYEMITGVLPFRHPNYNALMQSILHDEPRPTTDFRAGDSDLWTVIAKGLTKSPDDRWSSMTEFGEALALWLYEHGVKEDVCGNSVRALWLDGALSGIRAEVEDTDTVAPRPTSSGIAKLRPSLVETVITKPTWLDKLKAKARQYRHLLARRSKPAMVGVIGVLLGVSLTLAMVGQGGPEATESAPAPSPSPGTAERVTPPEPKAQEPPAEQVAPEPTESDTKPATSAAAAAAASAQEAVAASPPKAAKPAASKPAPRPRATARPKAGQPRSIRDFGF